MPSYIETSIGRKYFITGQAPYLGSDSITRTIATDPLRDYRNVFFQIPIRLIPNPPAPTPAPTAYATLQPRYYDYSLKSGKRISFRKLIRFNPDASADERWQMRVAFVSRDDDDAPLTGDTFFSGSSWAEVTTTANKYAIGVIFHYFNDRSISYPNTCTTFKNIALVNESGDVFKANFEQQSWSFGTGGSNSVYSNNIALALTGS